MDDVVNVLPVDFITFPWHFLVPVFALGWSESQDQLKKTTKEGHRNSDIWVWYLNMLSFLHTGVPLSIGRQAVQKQITFHGLLNDMNIINLFRKQWQNTEQINDQEKHKHQHKLGLIAVFHKRDAPQQALEQMTIGSWQAGMSSAVSLCVWLPVLMSACALPARWHKYPCLSTIWAPGVLDIFCWWYSSKVLHLPQLMYYLCKKQIAMEID